MACRCDGVWEKLRDALAQKLHRRTEEGDHLGYLARRRSAKVTALTYCEICHRRWCLSLHSLPHSKADG
jgi:hypothetical protein